MSNKKRRTVGSRCTNIAGGVGKWTEEIVQEENGTCSAVKAGPGTLAKGFLEGCGELVPHFRWQGFQDGGQGPLGTTRSIRLAHTPSNINWMLSKLLPNSSTDISGSPAMSIQYGHSKKRNKSLYSGENNIAESWPFLKKNQVTLGWKVSKSQGPGLWWTFYVSASVSFVASGSRRRLFPAWLGVP